MDMSQNEVSVFGSKMASLREKTDTSLWPHFETSPYRYRRYIKKNVLITDIGKDTDQGLDIDIGIEKYR